MNIFKPLQQHPKSSLPGLVHMTDREYRQLDGVSHSFLRTACNNPDEANLYLTQQRVRTSDALELGTMLHTALLRPDEFDQLYYMTDDSRIVVEIGGAKPRATNKYKEWIAEQELIAAGRLIISIEDVSRINSMIMNIWEMFPWLWTSPTECVVQWHDNIVGPCKAMIDLPLVQCPYDDQTYCVDIKTVGLDPLGRPYVPMMDSAEAMINNGHFTQGAFYREALSTVTDMPIISANLYIIKEFPYTPYMVIHQSHSAITTGNMLLKQLKQNYRAHFSGGKYIKQPLLFQV
jgi:hypothetical protein